MAYIKNYIGTGKPTEKNPEFGIVKVTLHMDKVEQFIYEKDGKKYLSFEVAQKKEGKDEFGRTHNVYVVTKEDGKPETETEPDPEPKKKNGKTKKGA